MKGPSEEQDRQPGTSLLVVKELLGHASMGMVLRYARLSERSLREAGEHEDSPQVDVRVVVGEPPSAGSHRRLADDALTKGLPVGGALHREPHLTRTTREELVTCVPETADPQ